MDDFKQFLLSIFSGLISSFIYGLIISGNSNLNIYSFSIVLINNWFFLLIIFVIMTALVFQILRIFKRCNVTRYQEILPLVAIDFIHAYNLIWQVTIQDNYITNNLPNFTYNLSGPFCPKVWGDDICLTPLIIKNRLFYYTLICPNCNARYFKFKNLDCYKKEIQLKIQPHLIKNKISTSEAFIEFIKNNKYF